MTIEDKLKELGFYLNSIHKNYDEYCYNFEMEKLNKALYLTVIIKDNLIDEVLLEDLRNQIPLHTVKNMTQVEDLINTLRPIK